MAHVSGVSTKTLLDKVRQFALADPSVQGLDAAIKQALIMADRELRECDPFGPLAWDVVFYDGIRTCAPADISAITQANPGVITAQSVDGDITGHGFPDHSSAMGIIVVIDGVDGMEELNRRIYQLQYINGTTFSLKSLDGSYAINSTNYTEYVSGGYVYQVGVILGISTILTGVSSKWGFSRVLPGVAFDGFPTIPLDMDIVREQRWPLDIGLAGRPSKATEWQHLSNPDTPTTQHILLWFPPCGDAYNVSFQYQKEIPDMDTWDGTAYPFHPPQTHEYLWHGALSKLISMQDRAKRSTAERIYMRVEVMFASHWIAEWERDKIKTRKLSQAMRGATGGFREVSA